MIENEILLITRVRTLNKGNQALSAAWLAMLDKAFPGAPIRLLERRPRHLLQFTLPQLARERDPIAAFETLTTKLANLSPGPGLAGGAIPAPKILLDETLPAQERFLALRQRLNLRGWASRAGLYREEYLHRLSACERAKLVVVNPAGEFFPRDPLPAFYHLLDVYVAHKLGCATAIVNHTMDIDDATLRKLIPHVYRKLGLVGFRDETSVAPFKAMGGDMANVIVTPDLALTTQITRTVARRANTIGVAINVPEAVARGYAQPWIDVIAKLVAAKFDVVLISNELPTDLSFYEQIRARVPGVPIEGANLDHDRYAEMMGSYDFVITSRMHTGILAMCAGAPVVPVEGASFKITGLFNELGFSSPIVRPPEAGWVDAIVERSLAMRARRDEAARDVTERVGTVRARITGALVPRLQQAAVG